MFLIVTVPVMLGIILRKISHGMTSKLEPLAKKISISCSEGDVITLSGPLGVGKTTFAKYLIQYLVDENIEVTSPTYNIIQSYRRFDEIEILHMDFYRLNDKTNIYDLDIIESFENAISIIEWPEKLIEFIKLIINKK